MIRHLQRHEIDRDRWDACIRQSFNGIIYAYSWYLDVVCPPWEALVEGNYESVMPLTAGRKLGISYLYPPFFVQQLGVFSVKKLTADEVARFLDAVPSKYKYREINLNTFNKASSVRGYELHPHLTHELDLIKSAEQLRADYSDNTARNLKKALKLNPVFTNSPSREAIITLFRNGRGRNVSALREVHYDMLRQLLQALDARGRLHSRGVTDANGELLAGAFFADANGKVIFLFSGLSEAGKEARAMFALIDRFITENAHKNLVLDFEGSDDPQLARFYRGFGAKECVYLQARSNRLPRLLRLLKK
ncbi:MAG: GNAT family N-acetyltransferase [Bacteroidia bacterium]|jgi:hypothetical protein|nr:GNAT family N-acetyltransferase [Bacteroidia bacterium]